MCVFIFSRKGTVPQLSNLRPTATFIPTAVGWSHVTCCSTSPDTAATSLTCERFVLLAVAVTGLGLALGPREEESQLAMVRGSLLG